MKSNEKNIDACIHRRYCHSCRHVSVWFGFLQPTPFIPTLYCNTCIRLGLYCWLMISSHYNVILFKEFIRYDIQSFKMFAFCLWIVNSPQMVWYSNGWWSIGFPSRTQHISVNPPVNAVLLKCDREESGWCWGHAWVSHKAPLTPFHLRQHQEQLVCGACNLLDYYQVWTHQ